MSDVIDSDGFRSNVGIVLMHGDEVFLGRRTGGRGWQFPQGGVRAGEAPEQALYRELDGEIGLEEAHVAPLGHTGDWVRCRPPSPCIRRNQHPVWSGTKPPWVPTRLQST